MQTDKFYHIDFNKDIDLQNLVLEVNKSKAAVLFKDGIIIIDNDCCHSVFTKNEHIVVGAYTRSSTGISIMPSHRVSFAHEEVKELIGEEITDIAEWIHYFGVKDRICYNYSLLKKTFREFGIEYKFPEWSK